MTGEKLSGLKAIQTARCDEDIGKLFVAKRTIRRCPVYSAWARRRWIGILRTTVLNLRNNLVQIGLAD